MKEQLIEKLRKLGFLNKIDETVQGEITFLKENGYSTDQIRVSYSIERGFNNQMIVKAIVEHPFGQKESSVNVYPGNLTGYDRSLESNTLGNEAKVLFENLFVQAERERIAQQKIEEESKNQQRIKEIEEERQKKQRQKEENEVRAKSWISVHGSELANLRVKHGFEYMHLAGIENAQMIIKDHKELNDFKLLEEDRWRNFDTMGKDDSPSIEILKAFDEFSSWPVCEKVTIEKDYDPYREYLVIKLRTISEVDIRIFKKY